MICIPSSHSLMKLSIIQVEVEVEVDILHIKAWGMGGGGVLSRPKSLAFNKSSNF